VSLIVAPSIGNHTRMLRLGVGIPQSSYCTSGARPGRVRRFSKLQHGQATTVRRAKHHQAVNHPALDTAIMDWSADIPIAI
jgi:hypothetical protein